MGYDPKKTLVKGLKHAAMTLGSIAMLAMVGYLSDAENVKAMVGDSPYALLAVPLLAGAAASFQNWLKHKDRDDTVSLPR